MRSTKYILFTVLFLFLIGTIGSQIPTIKPSPIEQISNTTLDIMRMSPYDVYTWRQIGAGNPFHYWYGWDTGAGALRYFRIGINAAGNAVLEAEEDIAYASNIYLPDDIEIRFGTGIDASMDFDDDDNAVIFGIPITGSNKGLIIADQVAVAADFNFGGLVTTTNQPVFVWVDADTDAWFKVGFIADDEPFLEASNGTLRINPNYEQNVTFFDGVNANGENPTITIYGYETDTASLWGQFQVDTSGNLIITAESGTIGFGNEHLTTTGDFTGTVIHLIETTTPGAVGSQGALYTQADNNLYFQDGDGNEYVVNLFEHALAEMYMYESASTITIDTTEEYHMMSGYSTGEVHGWSFEAGSTGPIASFASAGGNLINATDVGHGLVTGNDVSITGTSAPNDYNGVYTVTYISDDIFQFTKAGFNNSTTATWTEGSYLEAGTDAAGDYKVHMSITAAGVNAAKNWKFEIFLNSTECDTVVAEMTPSGTNHQNCASSGFVTIIVGDRIYVGVMNETDATNLALEHANVNLIRI